MKHLSDIVGMLLGVYILIAFFTWFAFSAVEPPHAYDINKNGPTADAFLKAMVWPYSVIEYNRTH